MLKATLCKCSLHSVECLSLYQIWRPCSGKGLFQLTVCHTVGGLIGCVSHVNACGIKNHTFVVREHSHGDTLSSEVSSLILCIQTEVTYSPILSVPHLPVNQLVAT